MKTLLILVFAALFAAESFGVDAVWKNTATAAQSWFAAGNWTDATTGEVLAEPPVGAEDTATFPDDAGLLRHSVNITEYGKSASVASVAGNATWRLVLPTSSQSNGNGDTLNFAVMDINSFKGEWQSSGSKKTLVLKAESGVQTLPVVLTSQQFALKVENAATTADIHQFRSTAGSFKKSGLGDVRIRDLAEPANLVLELEEGNIQIDGRAKAPLTVDSEILKKAAVHLDASATATWQEGSFVDNDGRTRINKWVDVHGGTTYAETWDNSGDSTPSHIKDIQPPFISPMTSSTGLPLVDFGACVSANVGTYGPQAVLRLHESVQVQEVFFVSALTDGTAVLGDTSSTAFNAADAYVFTDGSGLLADGGFARFNGNRCWQNCTWVSPHYRMVRTFDSYTADKTQLMLTNVKFGDGNAEPVRYLASDRLYHTAGNGSGGVRLGELIIFTTALTEEERTQVTDYLMRKWFASYDHDDFHVACAADGTSITVPEGRIARIGTLRVNGTKFTKKGGGTLQVGRVYPEDLTITVDGGDISLNTVVATEAVTEPVGTPQLWFDADYNESVSFVKDENDKVTAWCDRRGTGKKATRLNYAQITDYPYMDTESLPGRTVLTFPAGAAFQMANDSGQRESFVAFCYVDDVLGYNVLGYGYPTDRYSGGVSSVFARYEVGPDAMGGGIYSVDGKPVRPFELTGSTFTAGKWHVVHMATIGTYDLERLASNGPRSWTGHIRYGEVITYSTALTPDERRQNIDYLMNKWAGSRHPEYAAPAKDVTLAFTGDAALGTETDAVFAKVSGAGSLTKTGAGAATVVASLDDKFVSLDVLGGSLSIAKEGYVDRSAFHFDAMNASSFEAFYVDADGNTNVSKWADTRANGVVANHIDKFVVSGTATFTATNPIVRHVAFSADGVVRPVLDFGTQTSGRDDDNPTGAGLYISPAYADIVEAHYIFGDNTKNTGTLDVFCGRYNEHFKRGLNGTLFRTGTVAADVMDGYIWVDNKPGSGSSYVSGTTEDYHLISIAPLSGKDIGAIGVDRNITAGGCRYGECIGFRKYQTDKERAYLQAFLMNKWFGGPAPVWTNDLPSVSVARGATLTVIGGSILTPSLTGGGTIEATRVMGIAALNLKATDRTTVEGLTVEGVADFAGAVAVNLSGADAARMKPGKYALVSATSFANLDLSQWTLSPAQQKNPHRFVQEGNTVFLEIQPNGLLFIVR